MVGVEKDMVSVIIPTYNNAKYLGEALDSVLAQTYPKLEIIVINDGSWDNTKEIIQPYLNRIGYIEQDNGGPAVARNNGLRRAQGEYIAFLDADDIWTSDKLQEQMKMFSLYPDVALVYSRWVNFNNVSNQEWPKKVHSGMVFEKLLADDFILLSSIVAKTAVIKRIRGFDETLFTAEDTNLYLKITRDYQVFGCDKVLVRRRKHANNLSERVDVHIGSLDNLDRISDMFPEARLENCPAIREAYILRGKQLIYLYFNKFKYNNCHDVCKRLKAMLPEERTFRIYGLITLCPNWLIAPGMKAWKNFKQLIRKILGLFYSTFRDHRNG
jgi:glycosyltransferase involved in cell wall biosynthesis